MAKEKKNPYVMTIGFKKNNPEHIQVAEFLNSLEREKAQYIVKAVLTYRTLEEKGEVPQTGGAVSYDYETIKSIVLQIMREQGADGKLPAVQPETASLQPAGNRTKKADHRRGSVNRLRRICDAGYHGIPQCFSESSIKKRQIHISYVCLPGFILYKM